MNKLIITPLDIIETDKGDVMHGMKSYDPGFSGFGEAYFSVVNHNAIKAWKRHHEMTLNLVVPVGKIKFVLFDDRDESNNNFQEIIISRAEEKIKNGRLVPVFLCLSSGFFLQLFSCFYDLNSAHILGRLLFRPEMLKVLK